MRHTLNIPAKSPYKILPPLIGVKITFLWSKPYPPIQYVLPRSNRSLWKSCIIEQLLRWKKTGWGYTFQRDNNQVIIIIFGPGIAIVNVFYSYTLIVVKHLSITDHIKYLILLFFLKTVAFIFQHNQPSFYIF